MSNLKKWQQMAGALKQKKEEAEREWRTRVGGPGEEPEKPPGKDEPPDDPEITEASDRCGMDSRHTLSGVVLVETETGDEVGVQYHWICAPVRFIATRGITFQFENEAGLFDVEINGDGSEASTEKLRMIARQLTWAKRALLWANGSIVKAVRIGKVEEEEEA